jgi:hypothetical protein
VRCNEDEELALTVVVYWPVSRSLVVCVMVVEELLDVPVKLPRASTPLSVRIGVLLLLTVVVVEFPVTLSPVDAVVVEVVVVPVLVSLVVWLTSVVMPLAVVLELPVVEKVPVTASVVVVLLLMVVLVELPVVVSVKFTS